MDSVNAYLHSRTTRLHPYQLSQVRGTHELIRLPHQKLRLWCNLRAVVPLLIATFVLSVFGAPASASEFYLATFGPPPLRFAPPPSKHEFNWPVPLIPLLQTNASTNTVEVSVTPVSPASTNAVLLSADSSNDTNSPSISLPSFSLPLPTGMSPLGSVPDSNFGSASNLLNISPQMLAEYFKTSLENAYRVSTNGQDVLFNPPVPKPPSSEAIYRVQ
jgi:hypothetical protein